MNAATTVRCVVDHLQQIGRDRMNIELHRLHQIMSIAIAVLTDD
jgi:hypothetical protein